MRGYGLPRYPEIECPDKADITYFGLKGESRRVNVKATSRRYWAKRERMNAKSVIHCELKEMA